MKKTQASEAKAKALAGLKKKVRGGLTFFLLLD
jgi:hypothetical protein